MATSGNSINNTIGANTTNSLLSHLRASSGEWDRFNDQTDVHGYYSGAGSPEGVVAADIGSIYSDTGAGASGIYYKTTDTVSSGWTSIPSGAGPMVDYNYTNLTTQLTTSTIIPADNTIPQITEGVQYISLAYTPKSASNILFIEFSSYIALQNAGFLNSTVAIFNGAANAIAAVNSLTLDTTAGATSVYVLGTQVAGTTSPITFSVRFGPNTANLVTMNGGIGGSSLYGGVGSGYFRITEYLPPGSASVAGAFSVVGQRFTTPGAFTYTPTAGMQYVEVELVGGGGGSGGVASPGLGNVSVSGPAGAGGYAKFILSAADVGVSLAGVLGAGGAGGAAGANIGISGSSTTLATAAPWTVAGGGFGAAGTAGVTSIAEASFGGAVTSGTGSIMATLTGGQGVASYGTAVNAFGGSGGSNPLGQGGGSRATGVVPFSDTGYAGTGFGAGGGGSIAVGTGIARAGRAGTAGIAIFKEYVIV